MKQIIDYVTIEASTRTKLYNLAVGMIKDGWQPLGGISVSVLTYPKTMTIYCQAMVKYAEAAQ